MNALQTLNATPIGAAARGVGRFAAATSSFTMRFQSRMSYGWQMLLSRTRIDYRAEIGDPATNSIVGAVVGWIARNLPESPVRIVVEGTTDPAYGPSAGGPGRMLRLLERPNPYYSGPLQWMATLVDWICSGDAYWMKERSPMGLVIALWWIPQRFLDPVWPGSGHISSPPLTDQNRDTFISHYEYTVDGTIYKVRENDVVHFRNGINPVNTRKGLSRLASLFREIFTDDEASNFTASLLKNLGVPGVILAPSNTGTVQGRTDPEAIKTTFMEKFGGDRRGEPMVMTAPTDIKVLSWSPNEMNLRELRRIPEERISGVLGVPAMVAQLGAGLERSSFTNYGEANVAAYTQGVIPSQRLLAADLEIQLLPDFDDSDGLDVWFDWTKASAMQMFADQVWKRNESSATKGLLTRADFKRAIGKPVTAEDDVYILASNYLVLPAGGSQPPGSGTRRIPAAIQGDFGSQPEIEASTPLLLTTEAVRCESCNTLLAEQATAPYRFTCRKCHVVTEVEVAA